jgi:hypothetical protein
MEGIVCLDFRDPGELRAIPDSQGSMEKPPAMVQKDSVEMIVASAPRPGTALGETRESTGTQVYLDLVGSPDPPDRWDQKDVLVLMDFPEHLEHLVRLGEMVPLVFRD